MGRIVMSGASAGKLEHTTAAYLEAVSSPRVKVRFKGDAFTNLPTFNFRNLFRFTGKNNLRVALNRNGSDISLLYGEDGNGITGTSSVLLSSLSTTDDYIVYFKAGDGAASTGSIALYDSTGTAVIGPTSVPAFVTGTSGAGTGAFQILDGANAYAIDLAGAVLYSADPPSNWDTPATGDSGLLNLWWLQDGGGSTAASANGATALTVTNGTFNGTSDAWDASGGGSKPYRAWLP